MGKSPGFNKGINMRNVVIEESGWLLDYNTSGAHPHNLVLSIMDAVPGGTRGMINFSESDIRAFLVLFKKFSLLKEHSIKKIKDEDLFEDNETIADQIKNKVSKT